MPSPGSPDFGATGSYGSPAESPSGSYRRPGEPGPGPEYGRTGEYPRPAEPSRPGSGAYLAPRSGEYGTGGYPTSEYPAWSRAPANGNGHYGDAGYPAAGASTAAFDRPGGYGPPAGGPGANGSPSGGPGGPPPGGPGTVPGRAAGAGAGPGAGSPGWVPDPAAGSASGPASGEPYPDEGRSRRRRRGGPQNGGPENAGPQNTGPDNARPAAAAQQTPWVFGGPEPGDPAQDSRPPSRGLGAFDDPGPEAPGGPSRGRGRPSHVPGPGTEEDTGGRGSRGRRGGRAARGEPAEETFIPGFLGGGGGPSGPGPAAPPPRRKRRLGRLLAPLLALVLLAGLAGGGVYIYRRLQSPDYSGAGTGEVTVQVKPGDSASSLAPLLVEKGVVASQTAFISAAKTSVNNGGANLEPGTFALHKHMKASLAWALLLSPKARLQTSVTIPDGLRLTKILPMLAKETGFPLSAYQAAAKQTSKLGLPSYAHGKLEGYLYPATYPIQHGTSALGVLQTMVAQYNREAANLNLGTEAAKKHMTPGGIITVASLLEAEGGSTSYYGRVARVIYNRLGNGTRLQLDSTVLYALNKFGYLLTPAQQNVNSPYNTFRHAGLPPGPIDNPSEAAIEAALNPAAGNWTYFVTVDPKTGLTKFTNSYTQFQKYEEECHANGAC
jgi:UPF0755 protein